MLFFNLQIRQHSADNLESWIHELEEPVSFLRNGFLLEWNLQRMHWTLRWDRKRATKDDKDTAQMAFCFSVNVGTWASASDSTTGKHTCAWNAQRQEAMPKKANWSWKRGSGTLHCWNAVSALQWGWKWDEGLEGCADAKTHEGKKKSQSAAASLFYHRVSLMLLLKCTFKRSSFVK